MAMRSRSLVPLGLVAAVMAAPWMPGCAQPPEFRQAVQVAADPRGDRPDIRHDAYGRPIYFRYIPMDGSPVRNGPPYGETKNGRRGQSPRTWRDADGDSDSDCDGGDACRLQFRDSRDARDSGRSDGG